MPGQPPLTAGPAPPPSFGVAPLTADLSYRAVVLGDLPLFYWPLAELSGTVAAELAGRRNGTYSGVTLGQTGLISNGDRAPVFDGIAGQVTLGAGLPSAAPITAEAWIRPTTVSVNWGTIVSRSSSWALQRFGGRFAFTTFGHQNYLTTGSPLTTGAAFYCVAVFKPDFSVDFYVNGAFVETVTGSADANAGSDAGAIATDQASEFLDAGVGHVAIYGYDLSAAQILAHWTAGSPSPAAIMLGPSVTASTSALALTAPTTVPLDAAAAQSGASLGLTAPTQVPLGASAGQSSASLSASAPTTVPLAASAGVSSASLGLSAATQIPLAPAAGQSTATLGLTAPTRIPLDASTGQSGTSLTATAPTQIPIQPSAAQSDASLAAAAPTQIDLGTSTGQSAATISLGAATEIALDPASATSSATLSATAATIVPLGPSAAQSATSLALTAPTKIPLAPASAVSSATLSVTAPGVALVPLAAATAHSSAALSLSAPTGIALSPSQAHSSTNMILVTPARLKVRIDGAWRDAFIVTI